ncbi:CTP synthetase [Natrialbaceae archaeon A-CW3]
MNAIVAGPDEEGIADALEAAGLTVTRLDLDGHVTRPMLEEAGILEARLYVLTDVSESTTIPIVRDLTDDIRTVVYDRNTIPEFVRGQLDLAVDPRLIDPDMLASELVPAE